MTSGNHKTAYICGPLTELPRRQQARVKTFYERLGDVCETVFGVRAFVPHEHYDPIKNPDPTPEEVDAAERHQVRDRSSYLIVVAIAPSWGGGIEVEMANENGVPVILLCPKRKLEARKISRLLRGNPAARSSPILAYTTQDKAIQMLKDELRRLQEKGGNG